jgi:hypothetical protein
MRNFKNYFLVVFTLLNVSFYSLKAEEDTCSIQLKKTEIELLEPLTLQITYKDIGEKKSSSLEYHILIEEVVNEGEEGLKKVISGHRIAPIAYWSEQGRIKERVLVFYDFRKKRVIFEKAGTYKIQVNAGEIFLTSFRFQVNLGLLNLEQMDPILKQKLLSTEFLKLMYLPEEKNVTGVQYAYELMAQYPQSALARYAKNYVAIANYSDFLTFAERNDNAPPLPSICGRTQGSA